MEHLTAFLTAIAHCQALPVETQEELQALLPHVEQELAEK